MQYSKATPHILLVIQRDKEGSSFVRNLVEFESHYGRNDGKQVLDIINNSAARYRFASNDMALGVIAVRNMDNMYGITTAAKELLRGVNIYGVKSSMDLSEDENFPKFLELAKALNTVYHV